MSQVVLGSADKLMFFSCESQTETAAPTNYNNPPVSALPLPPPPAVPIITKKRSRCRRKGKGIVMVEGRGGGGRGESADDDDDHDLHLWTERERRKKMKDMFSNLHHMLPHIPIKADKSTIVDEAVSYIQNLQVILQEFQRLKLERIQNGMKEYSNYNNDNAAGLIPAAPPSPGPPPVQFETWSWHNVVLNVCGEQAQFSVCALKKPNISSSICFFFEKHNLDVVFCNFISNQSCCIYMIQAQVPT